MNLKIEEIINAVDGICLNPEKIGNTIIQGIYTDSRGELEDGLFVPLVGEKFDGHNYIDSVYNRGAFATLSSKKEIVDDRLITIYVEDTKMALLHLAKYYSQLFDRPVVAITGSVGKTTTKEMVSAVLFQSMKVHKTQGNFNNEIGVPLTLFRTQEGDGVSVIEMGMNHFGEIRNLTNAALPDIAIITNIGTSHIENLGSREGILKAKLEILEGVKSNGTVIVNGDEPLLVGAKQEGWITYGLSDTNDYYATNIVHSSVVVSATLHTPIAEYDVCIPSPGEHMVRNALAAVAVAEKLGLQKKAIIRGIASYKSAQRRMDISIGKVTIIDDTYNASVDSMVAALQVLENFDQTSRKVAILGDMFELGEYSQRLHQELGNKIATMNLDFVYTVGTDAEQINIGIDGAIPNKHYPNKQLFIEHLAENLKLHDVVLLKASRGMRFEYIVEAIGKVNYDG
ncbi:MAG: hypothetical protein ATN35_07190 [Epulopiscium sp. Nele67-Bin004]|nr:MAG: hypothetical protein ATN35_07190 [Epulopiscium sp. Nele67-Bin004]